MRDVSELFQQISCLFPFFGPMLYLVSGCRFFSFARSLLRNTSDTFCVGDYWRRCLMMVHVLSSAYSSVFHKYITSLLNIVFTRIETNGCIFIFSKYVSRNKHPVRLIHFEKEIFLYTIKTCHCCSQDVSCFSSITLLV